MSCKRNRSPSSEPRPVHVAHVSGDDPLNTVNNLWIPSRFMLNTHNFNEDTIQKQVIVKKLTGLLNKITPENFHIICQQLSQLSMDSSDLAKAMVILYEKATSEPIYCTIYVQLSNFISSHFMEIIQRSIGFDADNEATNFTKLLLSKCLYEFDRDIYTDVKIDERVNNIKNCTDLRMKQKLVDELDWYKLKARKTAMGNMKLIAELYLADMVELSIINSCIQKLLSSLDEENIERLCTLIRTIGAKFVYELEQSSSSSSSVFEQEIIEPLARLACNNSLNQSQDLTSRIRFMILDVLEMSRNDWREREIFKQNQPRTLREIRSEFLQVEE